MKHSFIACVMLMYFTILECQSIFLSSQAQQPVFSNIFIACLRWCDWEDYIMCLTCLHARMFDDMNKSVSDKVHFSRQTLKNIMIFKKHPGVLCFAQLHCTRIADFIFPSEMEKTSTWLSRSHGGATPRWKSPPRNHSTPSSRYIRLIHLENLSKVLLLGVYY